MGQATCGDPGGCGEILDAPGDADELADQERHWDTVVRQAINVATKAAGKTPGHLERLVNELGRPVNNWRETLRRFVDQSTRLDYSWRRPDRRFAAADFLMPGAVSDGVNHVVIVNDTSASLYADKPQKRFATEIQSLLDENVVDRITLIDCDNHVNNVQTFEAGDVVKFTNRGGGGTSFKPVWEWLKDNQEDTACVVYFTDLEPCDGYGTEPDLPVLWATYGDPRTVRPLMDKVPFGECVEVAE
jgi:predicted metal-dependent peptidase